MYFNSEDRRENKIDTLSLNQKGISLILVTLILVVSSVLALALITYYQTAALTSEVEAYRMQALYLAESGVNRAVFSLSKNLSLISSMNYTFFQGQTGSYTGRFDLTWDSVTRIINSTGTVPVGKDRQAIRTLLVGLDSNFRIISWREETKAR